jgi:type III secretory pathway component EscS
MARLSSFEVLNLILVLTNCQVVVAVFLGLAMVAGLTELPATEDRTAEKVARMVVVAEIAALQLDLVENS